MSQFYNARQYQTLESEKYWLPIAKRDYRVVRKMRRQQTFARVLMFGFFATGAALGYMYCTGQFENVDLVATADQVKSWLNI